MKNSKKQKYRCKRVQKLGQKCKNSPVNLYTTNMSQTPDNTAS